MAFTLSPELQNKLYQALLDCEEFTTTMRLQGDLAKYNKVFEYPHKTKQEFVKRTLRYLSGQTVPGINHVLPQFLVVLVNTLREDNVFRDELEMLCTIMEDELDELQSHAQTSTKTTLATNRVLPPPSPSLPAPDPINEIFLERNDRKKIEAILRNALDRTPNTAGKKSLLRDCGLPDTIISTVHFQWDTSNLAEEMVGLAIMWDQPHPALKCLENFVSLLVEDAGYTGNRIETEMKEIIVRYNQNRKLHASNVRSHKEYVPLRPEEDAIARQFQAARDTNNHAPFQVSPKLDIHKIVQCNLDPQRTSFITGFNGYYNGFFTFAIASVEYSVLMNYVLKSLLWELEKRTDRPAMVHHISLYPEHLDLSNVERGTLSLQKQVSKFFRGKSLQDVLEETQEANLAIVFRMENALPPHFKESARQFSETLKQQISDMLQNRYLIIFWANHGQAPIAPLDVSVVLPPFERFKVEHVIGWLDTSLRSQLKAQNIPEQDIQQWRERLVEKIKDHDGRLPGTYEVLLESLERGGTF